MPLASLYTHTLALSISLHRADVYITGVGVITSIVSTGDDRGVAPECYVIYYSRSAHA